MRLRHGLRNGNARNVVLARPALVRFTSETERSESGGSGCVAAYLDEVAQLTERWRAMLRAASDPRVDAAAWAIIDMLPARPVVTSAIAGAATGRAKASIDDALEQLADAGVLVPIAGGGRNRSWEVAGLLDRIADLEAGELPT
jgi:hypothetical protein